jgi:hypothetical protein
MAGTLTDPVAWRAQEGLRPRKASLRGSRIQEVRWFKVYGNSQSKATAEDAGVLVTKASLESKGEIVGLDRPRGGLRANRVGRTGPQEVYAQAGLAE